MTPRIGELIALGASIAGAAGLAASALVRRPRPPSASLPRPDSRATLALVLTLAALAAFLAATLSTYSGILRVWEGPVLTGFEEELRAGTSPLAALGKRVLWNEGLLSTGHDSLFYGLPTSLLFRWSGISVFTLRAAAAAATLAGIAVAFLFARRFFDAGTAATLAVVLALNPCVLFYARYGTSVAGTLLAVWIALYGTWRLLTLERPGARDGALAAGGLFFLTLQYAPGRLLAIFLLAFVPSVLALRRRRPRPWLAIAVLLACAGGVWLAQKRLDHASKLLDARGEHFLGFLKQPEVLRYYLEREQAEAPPDGLALAGLLVRANASPFAALVAPLAPLEERGTGAAWDPPRLGLQLSSMLPFALWGLALSIRASTRDVRHAVLVGGAVALAVPLLLTTRCDLHRLSCLLPFLAVWAALGLRAAWEALRAAGVPRAAAVSLATVLAAGNAWAAYASQTYEGPPPEAPIARALEREIAGARGPVQLGILGDERDVSLARLPLLDRLRGRPGFPPTLIGVDVRNGLARDPAANPRALQALSAFTNEGLVILGPASRFAALRSMLAAGGLAATETGTPDFPLLRVERARPRGEEP